jgi:ABC-type sugar transport system ATPase subunit
MDEPITHLDAKLRHQMRAELKDMQANLDTTTIYVTHDYLEALSLGDRIAVINKGQIEQIGTPEEIFHQPKNEFVASSFGEPEINIISAKVGNKQGEIYLSIFNGKTEFVLPQKVKNLIEHEGLSEIRIGLRAGNIKYSLDRQNKNSIPVKVTNFEPLGAKAILTVDVADSTLQLLVPSMIGLKYGQEIYVELELEKGILFDPNTRENLSYRGAERRGLVWQN